MAQLTERAKVMLTLSQTPEGIQEDANPFVREGGRTYMRYDGISIEHATDVFGGVNVCFFWKGIKNYMMRVDGPGMEGGATLNLNGVEGRMRVELRA